MTGPVDLAGLIVARVCHDLAGPAGALANGAELIADEPDPAIRAEFIAMIADGAARMGARLRFVRLAYGGLTDGPPVSADEARGTLAGLLSADGRLALEWRVARDTLPRDEARLLLVLAMLVADATEGRATLVVENDAAGVRDARAVDSAAIATLLEAGETSNAVPSRLAASLFARALAQHAGAKLRVDSGADWARVEVLQGI